MYPNKPKFKSSNYSSPLNRKAKFRLSKASFGLQTARILEFKASFEQASSSKTNSCLIRIQLVFTVS